MKRKNAIGIALLLLCSVNIAHATGREGGNGGDICEDRFKTVRDDISSWMTRGGADALVLPTGVSLASYQTAMLTQISKAKISCVDNAVMIGSAEKTCENFVDSTGVPEIVCNSKRFTETDQSDQYVLVHHEYAGLAGFEVNNGADSNYPISNQISGFLVDTVVKKLAVNPAATPPLSPQQHPVSCSGIINSYYGLNFSLKLDAISPSGVLTVTEDLDSFQGYPDVIGLKQLNNSLPDGHYTLVVKGNFICDFNPVANPPTFYCDAVSDTVPVTAVVENDKTGTKSSYDLKEVQLGGLTQFQTGIVDVTSISSVITLFLNNDNTGVRLYQTITFPDESSDYGCSLVN